MPCARAHLAGLEGDAVASAGAISRAQRVPEALLRKLLQKLCRAELVASEQGLRGGFRLARPPEDISILDVAETVQGKVAVSRCFLGKDRCPNQPRCRISAKLTGVQDHLVDVFKEVSLADLVGKAKGGSP